MATQEVNLSKITTKGLLTFTADVTLIEKNFELILRALQSHGEMLNSFNDKHSKM